MVRGDYAQPSDPYGIEAEYSAQSATDVATSPRATSGVDQRGNTLTVPRSIPTQAEVDAIVERGKS